MGAPQESALHAAAGCHRGGMRTRLALAAPVLALALALAACGGGHKADASPSHAASTAPSLAELGAAACNGVALSPEDPQLYVREQATCGGVTVFRFNDNAARDTWLKIARSFGGSYAVGDLWVVGADSAAPVQVAAAKLGGKVE